MKRNPYKSQPSKAQTQAKAAQLRAEISGLQRELGNIFNVSSLALRNGQ